VLVVSRSSGGYDDVHGLRGDGAGMSDCLGDESYEGTYEENVDQ
jgi:hypothetical protein